MAHLRSWWYRPPGFTNFGDELGAVFLRLLGHEVERVPLEDADIITTGSILQRLATITTSPGLIVWGSGWHKAAIGPRPDLDIRALRGRITAQMLGVDVPLGDPGLLASHFWPHTETINGRTGYVAHYIDDQDIPGTTRIDVRAEPETVCREISACATVISSSLHGCIVAASYGIPYMRLPHPKVAGGNTKWIDFTTSLDAPLATIQRRLLASIENL